MARHRRDEIEAFRRHRPRRGAAAAFAAVTAIALAGTVYLASHAAAVKADEHALAGARSCAAQGGQSGDCVEDVAGAAVGPLKHKYKSKATKLTVSNGGTAQRTFTFHRSVGSEFEHIQDGDFVDLVTWRGDIVAVTVQGESESTPAAPSERYRSRLATAFFAGAVALVLAGLTLLSATMTEGFFRESLRRPGFFAAGLVIYAGCATGVTAALIPQVSKISDALLTAPILLAAGIVVVGGARLWTRFRPAQNPGARAGRQASPSNR